jgi:hypothetical protein
MWKLITDIPAVIVPFAWIAAILNVVLPGFGTILIGCLGNRADGEFSKT